MDRDALADFLRRRRAALQPSDVGLNAGRRRRTEGLRREEVAALAHMSTDFYTRLEQNRGSNPSEATLGALARALRLSQDERDHLYALGGRTPPPRGLRSDHVTPALLRVLDRLDTPAHVSSDLGVVLAQNQLSVALIGSHTGFTGLRRSIYYRWFTEPEARSWWDPEQWEAHSRAYVASLRGVLGRSAADSEVHQLIAELQSRSSEFAALWERHEVGRRPEFRKRIMHPVIGPLALDCQILSTENLSELLVVFTADPGSEDAERLALLSVVGGEQFAPAPASTLG